MGQAESSGGQMAYLLFAKPIDRSLFHWGTTIPGPQLGRLEAWLDRTLLEGDSVEVVLALDGIDFPAVIRKADRRESPGESVQLRYDTEESFKSHLASIDPAYFRRVENEHAVRRVAGERRPRTDTEGAPSIALWLSDVPGRIDIKVTPHPDSAQLRAGLSRVLKDYPAQRDQGSFSGNALAGFIRDELPALVTHLTPSSGTYLFKGSAGTGNWADCPWVAVLDPDVTNTVQTGFYPVYLFAQDGSRVYLSLNQGMTQLVKEHGRKQARTILSHRARLYRSLLGMLPDELNLDGPIDLAVEGASASAAYYELGHICGACYEATAMPSESRLRGDYTLAVETYQRLAALVDPEVEPDVESSGEAEDEDYTKWRVHKRLDRNASLSRKAKQIHGYTCQACGIDMEEVYGPIGHRYIEAHHLVPVAELQGRVVRRDPKTDFAVLCPNCHRMIHRSGAPHDVEALSRVVHSEMVDI